MYLKLLVGGGFLGSHSFKGRTLETEALGSRPQMSEEDELQDTFVSGSPAVGCVPG